ncbi:MAG: 2-C-methyl-D-erythritol 2,4-cyclodiphosphate synthase [Cyanobacteriota bacterium]
MNQKVGIGYDIHRLVDGKPLIIGGIEIPFNLGLDGHSDADVLIHAIIDAMLGAIAQRDIGYHFSPEDMEYKDIDSTILLLKTKDILLQKEYKIYNIDSNIFAEKPKLKEYIDPMRKKLADILDVEIEDISIKAKTMEGLGLIGESKAIAAQAVVTVEKTPEPWYKGNDSWIKKL